MVCPPAAPGVPRLLAPPVQAAELGAAHAMGLWGKQSKSWKLNMVQPALLPQLGGWGASQPSSVGPVPVHPRAVGTIPRFVGWLAQHCHPSWARLPPSPQLEERGRARLVPRASLGHERPREHPCLQERRQECRQGQGAWQGWAPLPALPWHRWARPCPIVLVAAVTCSQSSRTSSSLGPEPAKAAVIYILCKGFN